MTNQDQQIYWHQGLFLRPQHFQLQDLFHQSQLEYRWRLAQPNGWGIRTLQVNEAALNTELFEVIDCEALTRGGWLATFGVQRRDANCSVDARSFKGLFDPGKGDLSVYLALPRQPHGHEGTATVDQGDAPYGGLARSSHLVPDLFDTTLAPVEIDFVMRKARLLFSQESSFEALSTAFELIKIAELVRTAESKTISHSSRFVYPCLTIGSSNLLLSQLKALQYTLLGKLDQLSETKRQLGVRATSKGIHEAIRLQMIQTLSRYVPMLQHHIELRAAHPEPIYGLLRQFVGELSVFDEEFSALGAQVQGREWGPNLPPYDHEDIWPRFNLAIDCIGIMVGRISSSPEVGIKLDYDGKIYFRAQIPEAFLDGQQNRYYLQVDSLLPGEEVWARLQRKGKLTTFEDMEQLRASHVFGLGLRHLLVPPQELPQRGGSSYFAVNTQDRVWNLIRDQRNICLFTDLVPNETVIKLLVVRDDE